MNRAERRRQGRLHSVPTTLLRPVADLNGYRQLRVVVPSHELSDEEFEEEVTRLRWQYAELVGVYRRATKGDFVILVIKGT
ncbi:MAG TPA: hypothetical protein VFU48_07440 [Nitrospira sp.]|nr:hypothetical protein [Nitrospira sp.]